jgi:hypothetical protein
MKTKNRKWIGPVPIAVVAALALAAFISMGLLLAPNGVQPAAAQDADCTVDATSLASVSCSTTNSMATVKFTGSPVFSAMGTPTKVDVLVADRSGSIRAYLSNHVAYDSSDDNRYELTADGATAVGGSATAGDAAPAPMRFRTQTVSVPAATRGSDGNYIAQSTTISVGGNVYLYTPGIPFTTAIPGGSLPSNDERSEIASGTSVVSIMFLGAPSVGTDGNDPGGMVDDVNQCLVGPNDTDDTIGTTILASSDCDVDDVFYGAESRSKLVVRAHNAGGFDPLTTTIITDGMMKDHIVMNNDDVTVYAVVKDAMDNARTGSDVVFTVSSVPMNAGPNYVRDAEAMKVVVSNATSEQVNVAGATASTTIMLDDAVAVRMIRDLSGMSYKVTVKVTIGDLNLGTVVIARAGDLDMVSAEACAVVGMGETDTKMDGCMTDYNPKMIYGPSTDDELSTFSIYAMAKDSQGTKVMPDSFIVKPATAATWWDALDCPMMNDAVMPMDDEPAVGSDDPMADPKSPYCAMYAGLSAEAMPVVMRAFGKAYGDATKAFNITATGTVPIDGMVPLTVKEDAPGAKYLLDVVASTGTGDKLITKSDQVKVIVSGELKEYMVDGPDYIALDGNATYTVTAMDENGNPPVFAMDENEVRILVQPSTVLVTNLDNDDLTLGTNTGMGEFTVFAPLGADDGAPGRIIVGSGTMQVIKNITFSMAMATTEMTPASTDLTAPTGVRADLFVGTSIIVTWDADSAQNTDLIIIALFNEGATALANIPNSTHPISLAAMDDPGAYSFSNVPSGTYEVAVASESDGVYEVSFAVEVVTVP